ncbi:MAG: SDR family NAD(P)-dependent oxidoreductase [Isosphaeraceae bacterium]
MASSWLHLAGSYSFEALVALSEARGRFLLASVGEEPGGMAALGVEPEVAAMLVDGAEGVVIANRNGPKQTVISGPRAGVAQVMAAARERKIRAQELPVACGFHSPLVSGARGPLTRLAASLQPVAPDRPVYSNVDALPYAGGGDVIARRLGDHAASPVRFDEMVQSLYRDGSRVFIEVGPGNVLSALVGSILGDAPHLAISVDAPARRGIPGFLVALGRLFAAGVSLDLPPLTAARHASSVSWDAGVFAPETTLSPSTWFVNGNRARPAFGPEPPRFGPGKALARHDAAGQRWTKGPTNPATVALEIPAMPGAAGSADAVYAAFQQTMRNFLDVQRTSMLQLLSARGRAPAPSAIATPAAVVKPKEPPSVVEARPAPVPVVEPAQDRGWLERKLLEIVCARTGYPAEMLRLDLDIEADLGIDSIKRVEILGSLRDAAPACFVGSESTLMDQLSRARTLGAIIERLQPVSADVAPATNGHAPVNGHVHAADNTGRGIDADATPLRRMLIEEVDEPPSDEPARLLRGGVVVITDDGRGIAAGLATRLREEGFQANRLVPTSGAAIVREPGVFELDLTNAESVARVVGELRRIGPITALVHAATLQRHPEAGLDSLVWRSRLGVETHGLFALARSLADDLSRAGERGSGALLGLTALGGGFASLGAPAEGWFPGQGALAGLIKTLAREWPEVRTRVVDLDPAEPVDRLVERIYDELFTSGHIAEVAWRDGRRVALEVVERSLEGATPSDFTLRPGEPVVITGGARGITALVAADLAERWQPRLLLMGTSPVPAAEEPATTRGLTDAATLKRLLLDQLKQAGASPSPVELERAYRSLRRDREIRANLARLRSLGSEVDYAQVDVRDHAALSAVLDRWTNLYGPPVGLIHGAGVIHDKLLRDKTPESMERVLSTKLDGALNLVRRLDVHPPRFTVFFSSVAGRFGNRGQSDYAAANDALSKLALWLDARWTGRVVSINWGPWSGVGMVSDLEQHLGKRGLGMIDPSEGATRVGDELLLGAKGDVEVVIAGDLGNLVATPVAKAAP